MFQTGKLCTGTQLCHSVTIALNETAASDRVGYLAIYITYVYFHMCTYASVCIYPVYIVCIHTSCIYIFMYTYVFSYINIYIHVYIHVYIYI